jgi:polyribonucleotide nucleotidyltransferase
MTVTTLSTELGGRTLTIETGKLARLAGGAVTVRYGDTVVLGTANRSEPRPGLDFFPLTIDFEERMYAAGKIPGGFIKREARPSEGAILAARLTRPIRRCSEILQGGKVHPTVSRPTRGRPDSRTSPPRRP